MPRNPRPPPLAPGPAKGGPAGLVGRASTLRNEISKYLARVPPGHVGIHLSTRRALLFLDGTCEYCRTRRATTIDHFRPLVVQRRPSGFCNDEWNSVPACQSCNSSKGNRQAVDWLRSAASGNPLSSPLMRPAHRAGLLARFDRYTEASELHCLRVVVDLDSYQIIDARIDEMLAELALRVRALSERMGEKCALGVAACPPP